MAGSTLSRYSYNVVTSAGGVALYVCLSSILRVVCFSVEFDAGRGEGGLESLG